MSIREQATNPTLAESDPDNADSADVDIRWWTGRTKGPTFSSDKVKWWTEQHINETDSVLNPCAGPTKLDVDDVLRVEVDAENGDADVYADFRDLLSKGYVEPASFDVIVYDPPYSLHQCVHKYGLDLGDDEFYFYDDEVKEYLDTLLAPGGTFIQFGYTTRTMPLSLGYQYEAVSVFNKTGCQNDYLGVVARKPLCPVESVDSIPTTVVSHSRVLPNQGASQIDNSSITVDGNGGQSIDAYYAQLPADSNYCNELSELASKWISPTDRVLHIYETGPRINFQTDSWTTCAYRCADLNTEYDDVIADVVETPWNIDAAFADGVFDVVILDLPHSAWQTNIRTPYCQNRDGPDVTHVDTAIKRSITDLVKGDGGRVIQVGKTATLMSGADYAYTRSGICVIRHPEKAQDRILVVDEKQHSNLELVSIGEGEVDGEYSHPHGAPNITSKYNRTDHPPSGDSHFCVHCGNHFYHHPAVYADCPDCGARPGDMCRHPDSGDLRHPTAPNHMITAEDVCEGRLKQAIKYHSGNCNGKQRTTLSEANSPRQPCDQPSTQKLESASISEFL